VHVLIVYMLEGVSVCIKGFMKTNFQNETERERERESENVQEPDGGCNKSIKKLNASGKRVSQRSLSEIPFQPVKHIRGHVRPFVAQMRLHDTPTSAPEFLSLSLFDAH
jgi:hypothetical protein